MSTRDIAQLDGLVQAARQRAALRQGSANAGSGTHRLADEIASVPAEQLLGQEPEATRALIRVARTIADLDAKDCIEPAHVTTALNCRPHGSLQCPPL